MNRYQSPLEVEVPTRAPRRFILAMVALLTLGLTLVGVGGRPDTAHAATAAINQCNYVETGAAREIICSVTVVNIFDIANGTTSSTVTTTVCAGAPGEAASACVTTPGSPTTDLVGSVNQCNNSVNAGGSIVTCNVRIVNNIIGSGSTSPASVNQCVGSGQGGGTQPTISCAPMSSASGADIIQCNTAGNNGGATQRVQCTALTSTVSSLWPVTIVQCNDSANGGGDLVTCTSRITTSIFPPGTPITDLPGTGSSSSGLLLLAVLVTALGAVTVFTTQRRVW